MDTQGRDLYTVLEAQREWNHAAIKSNYVRLVRLHHPDKLPPNSSEGERRTAEAAFLEIDKAWKVLGNPVTRAEYDAKLAQELSRCMPLSEDVDLDDMDYDEDDASYTHSCRCGGQYRVTEDELEAGTTLAGCSNCTLCIRLLYAMASD